MKDEKEPRKAGCDKCLLGGNFIRNSQFTAHRSIYQQGERPDIYGKGDVPSRPFQ